MKDKIPAWVTDLEMSNSQKNTISVLFHKYNVEYWQSNDFDQWEVESITYASDSFYTYFIKRKSWPYCWQGTISKIDRYLNIYFNHPDVKTTNLLNINLDDLENFNFWSDEPRWAPQYWATYVDERYKILWPKLPLDVKMLIYVKAEAEADSTLNNYGADL